MQLGPPIGFLTLFLLHENVIVIADGTVLHEDTSMQVRNLFFPRSLHSAFAALQFASTFMSRLHALYDVT